jgi:hypothetical protein
MRRFDRAMFAMFLLVLLADGSRSYALAPAAAQPGGLILSVASQFSASAGGVAVLAVRRADGSLAPIARWNRSSGSFTQWSRVLAARSGSGSVSNLLMLPVPALPSWTGRSAPSTILPQPAIPALAVFEHSGSPAP